jgi:hypothetical protein
MQLRSLYPANEANFTRTKLQKSMLSLAPLESAGVTILDYSNYREFMQLST